MNKIFRFTMAVCIFAMAALVFAGRAAAQSDYTVIDVQNGGAIAGVVKWSGPIPKIPKLPITKNPGRLRSGVAKDARFGTLAD